MRNHRNAFVRVSNTFDVLWRPKKYLDYSIGEFGISAIWWKLFDILFGLCSLIIWISFVNYFDLSHHYQTLREVIKKQLNVYAHHCNIRVFEWRDKVMALIMLWRHYQMTMRSSNYLQLLIESLNYRVYSDKYVSFRNKLTQLSLEHLLP